MGRMLPLLNSGQLLELGRPHLSYSFDENERILCGEVFVAGRFKIQIHLDHLPSLCACANLAGIRCRASLVGRDGLAVSLGDCDGVYTVEGVREVAVDGRDGSVHLAEPIVTYAFPEYKNVVHLRGRFKVRFEVTWKRRGGSGGGSGSGRGSELCREHGGDWRTEDEGKKEEEETVLYALETPEVELWYEAKGEAGEPGTIVRPVRRRR